MTYPQLMMMRIMMQQKCCDITSFVFALRRYVYGSLTNASSHDYKYNFGRTQHPLVGHISSPKV